jgi:hypothetical protein
LAVSEADYQNLEAQHQRKLVLSSDVTPETQKYISTSQQDYVGHYNKSYSYYGDVRAFENGTNQDNCIEKERALHKPQLEGRSDRYLRDSDLRIPATRANGTVLSQSTHHSPACKTEGHQKATTVGAGKKSGSVKEEISRFSYKRLVNHLERKYQDIRSIFKADKNVPRAQARLASPSLSPNKEPTPNAPPTDRPN